MQAIDATLGLARRQRPVPTLMRPPDKCLQAVKPRAPQATSPVEQPEGLDGGEQLLDVDMEARPVDVQAPAPGRDLGLAAVVGHRLPLERRALLGQLAGQRG